MVAGDDRTAVQSLEILNALYLFDYQLLVGNKIVNELVSHLERKFSLELFSLGLADIFDLVRHQYTSRRVSLHVLAESAFLLILFDLVEYLHTILCPFVPVYTVEEVVLTVYLLHSQRHKIRA